jgi:hypothetical protein
MKTANLRLQPGIEMVLQFPAIVGIGTILLQCTGITGLRLRAKLCDPR